MLYLDTCVLLAISPWSATELHSALGLKVRTQALSQEQADADALHLAIASGRNANLCSLDAPFVRAALQLGLDAILIGQPKCPDATEQS